MASQRVPPPQTQPRTYNPSFKAILSFPFRICNPPPAIGKVRSCGVTPLFQVRLEDVLDRKHLPPLGLKDFEEWLLYVELSPENLYFTLWLKEYTVKYSQWAAQSKSLRDEAGESTMNWTLQSSSQLAMFYARAKQTFFTPNSEYELNLSSSILAPFHASNGSPHPDPAIFSEVAIETTKMLRESLRRFVYAQYKNVGTNRVLCGIIAGIFFSLVGGLAPLVVNFIREESRWSRLAALPGLWIGLTVSLAALNGICLGVYVFGDFRQLRKFELSRPPISKPKPMPNRTDISVPISGPIIPLSHPPRLMIVPPPAAHHSIGRVLSRISTASSSSSITSNSSSSSSSEAGETTIQISPAYYDADPIDGPATSPISPEINYTFPEKGPDLGEDNSRASTFAATAGFIHPFDSWSDDDYYSDRTQYLPEERQSISSFDFSALPPRPHGSRIAQNLPHAQRLEAIPEDQPAANALTGFIARLQAKCVSAKWRSALGEVPSEGNRTSSSIGSSTLPNSRTRLEKSDVRVQKQFKRVQAVPAFASLTRVLNPIIVRGQWEIVVRSAVISFLISWIVLGTLLAVPIIR